MFMYFFALELVRYVTFSLGFGGKHSLATFQGASDRVHIRTRNRIAANAVHSTLGPSKIPPGGAVSKESPQHCGKVYWTKMVHHFGQNDAKGPCRTKNTTM